MKKANKFVQWVHEFGGPIPLGKELGVTPHAVRYWMHGKSRPKMKSLVHLMLLSNLKYDDIVTVKVEQPEIKRKKCSKCKQWI
ncbi:MAG TPA: hypothetical protein VIJ46_02960 [Rhabdochlamydiaceae bacterium]